MQLDKLEKYDLLQEEQIDDIQAKGYLLRHKKSGARIMLLENEDENKVFNIAFRTPPSDSTGVAHILEHSVLCGSKEFPLKDPFVELVKGSLNTFLNAMTYPDKTMYPVASCNEQDFKNLMHVYLDAVFYPNIYDQEEIFRQEGWSYQLEDKDAPLTYNGVVYSEMKGVFSSPEEMLDRAIFSSLFPDTTYGFESGGDPDEIPNLTYQEFLGFHKKYYHPSNSYIYLYGNMDMVERLEWLDEKYLSKFEESEVDSTIPYQKSFEQPKEVELSYPISENESEEDNAYISYNVVVGNNLDVELSLAFDVLDYALLSAPGAPLKQVLLDEKIGKDVFGSYQDGILQPFFSIIVKNAKEDKKEEFLRLIRETLEQIVKEGINQKSIAAGINFLEFRFREADFGSYPKGLMYGIDTFESWLYDEEKPFIHLQQLQVFENLKKKMSEGYFEKIISNYLLNNPHASVITAVPEKGLATQKEQKLQEQLDAYKANLSEEEIQKYIQNTKDLVSYQEAPESEQALACIPMLKRSDIKREAMKLYNEISEVDGTKVLHHNVCTNGIGYLNLLFDTKDVQAELLPYMGLLKSVLGFVDTKHYSYGELFNEINANTGGIVCGLSVFNGNKEVPYQARFGVRAKFLYNQLEFVLKMVEEILGSSNLKDEKRIYEIIAQSKSRLQMGLTGAGHSTAASRATSYFSPVAEFQEKVAGVDYYEFLVDLEKNFDEKKSHIFESFAKIMEIIFRKENLIVSFTAQEDGMKQLEKQLPEFINTLGVRSHDVCENSLSCPTEKKNEGFKTAGQVQYVAKAGNFVDAGYQFTGALNIAKVILGYEYLWKNIRVKGGAYGCMAGFKRCGDTYFVSYRDPNLRNTLDVFDGIPQFLRAFTADEREMTKYIIGTISGLDTPQTPATIGSLSLTAYFNKVTEEELQKEREQILDADTEAIRALADMIEAVLQQDNICVIGAENTIENEKELFLNVKDLI